MGGLLIPLFLLYHRVYIQALLEVTITFIQNGLCVNNELSNDIQIGTN